MADLIPNLKSYQDLLARLKRQIQTAQVRAAVSVNRELVMLYWGIGKEILSRQREDGWGRVSLTGWRRISGRNFRT